MEKIEFKGFSKECLEFLSSLERNNKREWFSKHRSEFDEFVLEPAKLFVVAMGEKLSGKVPAINARPKVDGSIFRIHRDTRFSKDKRPYKTHLGIYFWEGTKKKLECPGFYFQLEKDKLFLGGGMHILTREQLPVFQASVAHKKYGQQLEAILAKGRRDFKGSMEAEKYKRVPRAYAKDHPRAELLKLKGVTLGEESKVPASVHGSQAIDYVYTRFEKMLALHKWFKAMEKRA